MREAMNENVIEWFRGDKRAAITAPNNSRLKGRLVKMAEKYPEVCDVHIYSDGSVFGHVPIEFVSVRPSRAQRFSESDSEVLSEEQEEAFGIGDEDFITEDNSDEI